jgi:CheY-like chemotaxis protein
LKFTKKGQVDFGYNVLDNELEFFIKDTGIGISPKMSKVIFDRFRQVENTTTREFGGSGLGLTISKAYVNLLGGKIWLESEPDQGSTFYFTIPYKKNKTEINDTHSLDRNPKAGSTNKKIILVAEDEEDNFNFLEVLLSKNNFEVLWAKDGTEAVEICKANLQISLVFMDIKMPIMNGYEATKEIRKFNKELVIIAQTAYALQGDREKSLAAGCNDYISKPIRQQLFLELINKYT